MHKTILIIFLVSISHSFWAQDFRFRHITDKEGLRYTWVWDIYKDSEGFIWFSTQEGAFKFDGFNYERFSYSEGNAEANEGVFFVFEDSHKFIWFGTESGLNRYDKETNTYRSYNHAPQNENSISPGDANCMVQDDKGFLWIGTDNGLNRYDQDSSSFHHYLESGNNTISNNMVQALLIDSNQRLWVGCGDGILNLYDRQNNLFRRFKLFERDETFAINTLFEDSNNRIWVGFEGAGVAVFDQGKMKFDSHYLREIDNGLTNNYIRGIIEDNEGNIWMGSEKGITIYNPVNDDFRHIYSDLQNQTGLTDNAIYCLYKEENGDIWIGTFFGGVNVLHNRYKQFQCFLPDGTERNIGGKAISEIFHAKNKIYIGTEDNGLSIYNLDNQSFTHITEENSTLSYNNIHAVFIDSKRNLWVGTFTGGLNRQMQGKRQFIHYQASEDPHSISDNSIYKIFEDSNGILWIGTHFGGLNRFDYANNNFIRVFPEILGNTFIWDIMEDNLGNIWLAVYGSGIYKLDINNNYLPQKIKIPASNIVSMIQTSGGQILVGTEKEGILILNTDGGLARHLTTQNGLSDNTIYSIVEDDDGYIWFSTNSGLCKTSKEFYEFVTYTVSDGLPTNRFNYNSCERIDGKLYFGSTKGLVVVDPDFKYEFEPVPPIYLSSLSIFNEKIEVGRKPYLNQHINYINKIVLDHRSSSLSIEYAAISFCKSDKIQYAYRLDGLEKNWNYVSNKRKASYTNLDPGNYIFRIRTVDEKNYLLNNERNLSIIIQPPWWKTWWAQSSFLALLLSVIGLFIFLLLLRTKAKHALEIEKLERLKVEEVSDLKIKFFTNISHEFKTPLSLISGPISQLISQKNIVEVRKNWYYKLIKRNADRLLLLINELLEFRDIQNEHLSLKPEKIDVTEFIRDIYNNHIWLAEMKRINFTYQSKACNKEVYFDPVKFEKIISNLLSNALKYTPENGYISLECSVDSSCLKLYVKNSGTGISLENLPKIFDRYFKADITDSVSTGSGIGLTYAKTLVELHKGKIEVTSLPNVETCFLVKIPLILHEYINEIPNGDTLEFNKSSISTDLSLAKTDNFRFEGKARVLVVDDIKDMRDFIADSLKTNFQIISANNGFDAYKIAQTENPDIIVSDVLMPEMNGFELCSKIKNNFPTSHIRIVLLSALSENTFKIKGYKSGADAYISKPFDVELLISCINNLLINSNNTKLKYQQDLSVSHKELAYSDPDEKLLKLIIDTVNRHLDDSDFNIDDFSREVSLSKSTLNRKMKVLTGQSINEFVQTMRMKKAAKLIKETSMNISEISYTVGYSDPYYFSRSFKKHFNVPPKLYREKSKTL